MECGLSDDATNVPWCQGVTGIEIIILLMVFFKRVLFR